jgi:hypothetical protein
MADMERVRIEVDDDRRSLLMQVGDSSTFLEMNTSMVDETIEKLCFVRRAMLPEIPATWLAGRQEPITALRDLPFTLETDSLNGDPLLHIKHPRFGWLHFIFSRGVAE